MDNRIFNVNGEGLPLLREALKLVFAQADRAKVASWEFLPDRGCVLYWTDTGGTNKFPVPIDADAVAPIIHQWLESSVDASNMVFTGWDANNDHDGDNSEGWRVYCEDWGHVSGNWAAICAIRPVYLWHGK